MNRDSATKFSFSECVMMSDKNLSKSLFIDA